MHLTLATPVKKFFEKLEVEEVLVPADKGEINILEGHAPLLTTLTEGVLSYKVNGEFKKIAISWGYCEVSAGDVQILAEIAVAPENIVESEVKEEIKVAEKLIEDGLEPEELDEKLSQVRQGRAKLEAIH